MEAGEIVLMVDEKEFYDIDLYYYHFYDIEKHKINVNTFEEAIFHNGLNSYNIEVITL